MLKFFFASILIFSIMMISCQISTANYRIDPEKMAVVLADIHLSEVALQSVSVALKDSMAQLYYDQIYEMHQVNKEDFNHDLDLLRSRPTDLKVYYAKVVEQLVEGERKFLSQKPSPSK